jgi:hypothetical protein
MLVPDATTIIVLSVAASALILLMCLPIYFELRKPKDRGPKVIMADFPSLKMFIPYITSLANVDAEMEFDASLARRVAEIIAFLPSLEI